MIELIRKKHGWKILELRYPEILENNRKFAKVIIRSFNDIPAPEGWIKEEGCVMAIDLTKSEDELWKAFSENYRKHIRREERENIIIGKGIYEDYDIWYNDIYIPMCKEKKLIPYPIEYLRQGDLWISEKNGEMLAGQIIFHDDKNASQSFNSSIHVEYNGNRSITWTALKHYKKLGLSFFCFGGGFSKFKERFGSELKTVWNYEIINNPFIRFIEKMRHPSPPDISLSSRLSKPADKIFIGGDGRHREAIQIVEDLKPTEAEA